MINISALAAAAAHYDAGDPRRRHCTGDRRAGKRLITAYTVRVRARKKHLSEHFGLNEDENEDSD